MKCAGLSALAIFRRILLVIHEDDSRLSNIKSMLDSRTMTPRQQLEDDSRSDQELHNEAMGLNYELPELEKELVEWKAANPYGSAPGLAYKIAKKKDRIEVIIGILRDRGFLTAAPAKLDD